MVFRVPLLYPSALVVSRLDFHATANVDPVGAVAEGYDPELREPYTYESTQTTPQGLAKLADTVRYKPSVRIPCQVEVRTFDDIRQVFGGDAPNSNIVFVLHNRDLLRLGLLKKDGCNCTPILKTNDRVDRIEVLGSPGKTAQEFKEPLYIFAIHPGSWGMGPSGQDLQIVWTSDRAALPRSG